jgi:hypothetical protein
MSDLDPALAPEVREVAERLRGFFRTSFPEIEERMYDGARSAGYRVEGLGTICGLFVRGALVHLVFTRGAEIPDPDVLLRGEGPGVRYMTFRPGAPVPEDALFTLVVGAMMVAGGAADGLEPPPP